MSLPAQHDQDLLFRIARGDQEAFTRLFEQYHHRLGAFVFGITRSKEQAEEIVLDVFLKIWMTREGRFLIEVCQGIGRFSNFCGEEGVGVEVFCFWFFVSGLKVQCLLTASSIHYSLLTIALAIDFPNYHQPLTFPFPFNGKKDPGSS